MPPGWPPIQEAIAIRLGLIPTISEFVKYVVEEYPEGDPHWLPQTKILNFCSLPYDGILVVKGKSCEQIIPAFY